MGNPTLSRTGIYSNPSPRRRAHAATITALSLSAAWLAMPALAAGPGKSVPEIVVSASRLPVDIRKVGSAVTVITAEDLEKRGIRVVSDALRAVPGVAVDRSGPTGNLTQLRCRGAEANHTLVLIDGIEVGDPSAFGGTEFDFAHLQTTRIARIEVLRGPQSALYGSDAIGCVVNVVTDAGRKGLRVAGLSEIGSRLTRRLEGSVSGGFGDVLTFSLGGDWFKTAGANASQERRGNAENDGYLNRNLSGKLVFTPAEFLEMELVGGWTRTRLDFDSQPAIAGISVFTDSPNETHTVQRYGKAQARITLLDGRLEQLFQLQGTEKKTNALVVGFNNTARGARSKLTSQTSLRLNTDTLLPAEHALVFAWERETETLATTNQFGGVNDRALRSFGYVWEYRLGLMDRLFLSFGYRFDNNTKVFDDSRTYRVSAAYLLKETRTKLHGSVGRGVKNPGLLEMFGFSQNFVGNPNLRPESVIGWDMGVAQRGFDDRLTVDLTYFENNIGDLIQGAGNTAINLPGTSRIRGLEVSARAKPFAGMEIAASYTYTLGQDAGGTALVRRPRHVASVDATYTFLKGRARVGVGVDFNGAQRDFIFSNFFATRTVGRLASYTLVRLTAAYRIAKGVSLTGRIENAFDKSYEEVFSAGSEGIAGFIGLEAKLDILKP